jgi:acetyltransferase-like isoleucine patch superfamily enzyme
MKRPTISIPKFIIQALGRAGFLNLYTYNVFGPYERLHYNPETVGLSNTLFNTMSGEIWIGEDTFFGHNVMVITGKHYEGGPELFRNAYVKEGRDIRIGKNCWIASGAKINGGVTIGDNCKIKMGAIVVKNVPDNTEVTGIWK